MLDAVVWDANRMEVAIKEEIVNFIAILDRVITTLHECPFIANGF